MKILYYVKNGTGQYFEVVEEDEVIISHRKVELTPVSQLTLVPQSPSESISSALVSNAEHYRLFHSLASKQENEKE